MQLQKLNAEGQRILLLYPPGLELVCAFFGCLSPPPPPLPPSSLPLIRPHSFQRPKPVFDVGVASGYTCTRLHGWRCCHPHISA